MLCSTPRRGGAPVFDLSVHETQVCVLLIDSSDFGPLCVPSRRLRRPKHGPKTRIRIPIGGLPALPANGMACPREKRDEVSHVPQAPSGVPEGGADAATRAVGQTE